MSIDIADRLRHYSLPENRWLLDVEQDHIQAVMAVAADKIEGVRKQAQLMESTGTTTGKTLARLMRDALGE